MVQQRIHQRAVRIAGGRVHHHALGLVHHQQRVVLINDIQRNILGDDLHRAGRRHFHGDVLAGNRLGVFGRRTSAAQHQPLFHQLLDAASGQFRKALGQQAVQPLAGLLLPDLEFK